MFFVRSRVSGKWSTIDVHDIHGNKFGEKLLVRVTREVGAWSVDHRAVQVEPGLCVSFLNHGDADWFMQQGRAEMFGVEPGLIVAFELESDAMHFVRTNQGELLSTREVEEMMAELHAAHAAAEQEVEEPQQQQGEGEVMQKTKGMENKAATKPAETKANSAAKPAKGGKKGGK